MNRKHHNRGAVVFLLTVALFALFGCGPGLHRMMHHFHGMHAEHFDGMAHFGSRVMPFGHDRHRSGRGQRAAAVSHVFEKSESGVVYQVMANDADDADTIARIQEHLSRQVERIQRMNERMQSAKERRSERPYHRHRVGRVGLSRLAEFMDKITFSYGDLEDGGQITLSSEDSEVVEMLHAWLEREDKFN